jgi:hypothetical protein
MPTAAPPKAQRKASPASQIELIPPGMPQNPVADNKKPLAA